MSRVREGTIVTGRAEIHLASLPTFALLERSGGNRRQSHILLSQTIRSPNRRVPDIASWAYVALSAAE